MYLSDKVKQKYYTRAFIIIYILYIITFLGVITINNKYITQLRNVLEVVSCILLIIRFNPYSTHEITKFDRKLIFSVSTFLLINILISELYIYYSNIPFLNSFNKSVIISKSIDNSINKV